MRPREKKGGATSFREEPLVFPHVLHRGSLHRVRLQHVAEQGHLVAHDHDVFFNDNGVFFMLIVIFINIQSSSYHALVQVVGNRKDPTFDLPENDK